ncbi:MAG: insulinase family protein [Crocinitomicaceae bacterium]|jgi:predicted Zn-dependent peptidase|nr:insulinase family protein [Crocinitomicaceae bacterium]
MKKISILFLLLAPQFFHAQLDRSVRPKAAAAPQINIKDSETFTTANGINVIISENHKIPKVTFSLSMGSDPRAEGSKAGLSGIAGELVMSGTTNRDKDQLDKEIAYIGARLSASSGSVFLSCLTKHMDKGLGLMSDVLTNASFPESEFARIVSQNENGLKSIKASADGMASNALMKVNYGEGHPYADIMTEATLANITLDDVKAFYKNNFVPKGSYLVIVGDITKAEAEAAVNKYFSTWAGGEPFKARNLAGKPTAGNQVYFTKKPGAVQSVIRVSFPMNIKPGDPDQIALSVLNNILGGGAFGNRLMQNLREDKAYTYGCRSSINFDEFGTLFSTSGSFRNEVSDSAIVEIIKEIEGITEGYVTDEELNLTKSSMAGSFARSLESPQTVARFALNIKQYNLPKDYYQTYLQKLEKVSKEDILLMAQKYFTPKNLNIVVVGNESIIEKLKPFDKDGKIDLLDPFGNEAKEMKPADITADVLLNNYVLAVTQSANLKTATKKLKKIKSVTRKTEMSADQVPFPLNMTEVWIAPNMEGSKLEGQGMLLQKSYFDGKAGGTVSMQAGKEAMTADEIAAKAKSAGLIPEMNYSTSGMKYEMVGIEVIDGKDVYVLKLNDGDSETLAYYEKGTWNKVKTITTSEREGQTVTTEQTFADFKDYNGVMMPTKVTLSVGPLNFSGKVTEILINEKVDIETYK